jgi:hypothetical protein
MNYDNDLYHEFKLAKRKPLNLIYNLMGRELGTCSNTLILKSFHSEHANKNEKSSYNQLKRVYLCVYPNYTILNVKMPNCYLRRFSPDGRFLVAFNHNLTGIQIFYYKGCTSGAIDLEKIQNPVSSQFTRTSPPSSRATTSNDKTDFNDPNADQFRYRAFDTYFQELAFLKLTENNELMNRECALFFKNNYLIVASSEIVSEENYPPYDLMTSNNESLHFGGIENYTIYLVDIKNGKLCDKLKYKADKISLTHNQSLGLFKNIFTVLSQQNQTINVYNIVADIILDSIEDYSKSNVFKQDVRYKFVLVNQIGRFCFSDDSDILQYPTINSNTENATASAVSSSGSSAQTRVKAATSISTQPTQIKTRHSYGSSFSTAALQNLPKNNKPFTEVSYTSMKQRMLTFFYNQALRTNSLGKKKRHQ